MAHLLEVRDLQTHFPTRSGLVRAVDGVSFYLDRGELLGLVGESGCGKSITALSVMRLIAPPGKIVNGEILFDGKDLLKLSDSGMRQMRGDDIAMIFQDPMTSLNPVFTVGEQIAEALRLHRKMSHKQARAASVVLRQRGHQRLRVGMARRGEDLRHRSRLDLLARVHHDDALRRLGDDREIVGDEDQRHPLLALQPDQEIEHLRLDGDVERRRRLVRDQQPRLACDGHRDHHPLRHAAGELVRKGEKPRLGVGNLHLPQQLQRPRAAHAAALTVSA